VTFVLFSCTVYKLSCQKNYSNPRCSLHPPYITFFPLLGNIHLSLDYESPQNFLTSHQNQKIGLPVILLTCSLPLPDFIIVFFQCIYCFFSVCVSLFSLYNFVQPLAITFNKRYILITYLHLHFAYIWFACVFSSLPSYQ